MRKNYLLSMLVVCLFALGASGCGGDSPSDPSGESTVETAPPSEEIVETADEDLTSLRLSGTSWMLESFGGVGDLVPSEPDVVSTLNFVADQYMGTGGCNFFLGVYDVPQGELRMESPLITMLDCEQPEGVMDQESTFVDALLNSTHYKLEDDKLTFYTVEDQRLVTMASAESVPLQGTVWSLRFIVADGEAQPLISGTTVTALSDGRQLTGNAGCNDYSAALTRENDTFEVGELTVTEETCVSPEYIMVQETDYLTALQSATSLKELANVLILYDSDGVPVLLFGTQ